MSTYKRSTGNIVFESTTANSSVSFIGPTANAISVVINGDLSVSGNASLTGNIAGDKIFNGTSSIEIPSASGNILMSVGGTSNVMVVSSTGVTFAGAIGFSGNVAAGNISSAGIVTAVGNVNTSANINANGNIIITRDAGVGQPTFRFNDSNTTVAINTVLGAVEWFTNDAAPGARVTTAVRSVATSATGNARYEVLTSTDGAAATAKFVVDNVGNVGVANTAPLHTFAVSGTSYVSGTATVVGNVTGGNLITAGLVSATGNITSAANIAGGNISATGNVTANNLTASSRITAGAAGISATGNVTGGNLISTGIISATGNLTTTDIFATTVSASGNITGANVNVSGVANASSVRASTTISATGNVTGGNVTTAGQVSATGNLVGGNIISAGIVSGAGNVVTGAFFIGDGGFLSNVTAAANSVATKIQSGTTEVGISTPNGNIVGTVNGVANVFVISTNTFAVTGAISASGNITGGNVNVGTGLISSTGNVNVGNVNATFGNFNTVIGAANASNLTTGTVPSDRLAGIYAINISGYSATVSSAAQPNITSVGNMSSLSVVGNTTSGNLITAGQVSATGNVTGAFILGNITFASGYNASKIFNGTSEANIGTSGGNANISIGGTSNVVVVATTGVTVSGIVSATGNVNGGNLNISGGIFDSSQLDIQTTALNSNIVLTPNGTGNVNIGRMSASGNITAVAFYGNGASLSSLTGGNVTGTVANATFATSAGSATSATTAGTVTTNAQPNITSVGTLSSLTVTANITSSSGQFIGSGAGLTSIPGANVTGTVPSATSATSATTAGTVTAASQPNITSVGTLTSLSVTGNVTAGNVIATHFGSGAGLSSITGANVTGTVANATFATSAGSATSATTAGTVTTAAQPNITSVGTLSSLAVTANITGGNLSVSTGTITAGNIVNANGNGVGNIGSSVTYYNTVFARATSALYADLAEKFLADQPYEPGTVLVFGGEKEVTISTADSDHRVAGVVSTDPSYLMNSGLTGDYAVELALQGRVPCKVFGPIEKGDLIVSSHSGHARGAKSAPAGTIIGKSLVNFDGESGVIEIVVGRD